MNKNENAIITPQHFWSQNNFMACRRLLLSSLSLASLLSSLSSQFSHNQSLNLQRNRRLPSTVVDSSHEAIPDSSSSSQPSASQHLEVTFGGAPSTEEADEGPTGSEKSSESSTTTANKPPGVDKKLGNKIIQSISNSINIEYAW